MEISEDIGKAFPRLLEPGKAEPGDDGGGNQVDAEHGEIRRLAPEEYVARLLNDRRQRVHVQQGAVGLGQGRGRVEDGREEHQDRGQDADELAHIAQVNTQRCQRPAQAHDEETKGQEDQRQVEDRGMRQAEENQVGNQPDAEAHCTMKERRSQTNPGQDFEREDDLLDIVLVAHDQAWRPIDAFGKQVEDDQTGKQHECKFGFGVTAGAPACLEDDAEEEGVNNQHEQRVEERPEDAHEGAAIAAHHVAFDGGFDEAAVAPEAGNDLARGGRKILHQAKVSASDRRLAAASLAASLGSPSKGHSMPSAGSFHSRLRSNSGA